jgi:hypothetical protein
MDGSLAHRRREIGVRKVLFSVATKALLALDSFLFLYLYIDKVVQVRCWAPSEQKV